MVNSLCLSVVADSIFLPFAMLRCFYEQNDIYDQQTYIMDYPRELRKFPTNFQLHLQHTLLPLSAYQEGHLNETFTCCVELARNIVTEMERGIVVDSSSNLQELQVAGTEFANQAEDIAKRLTKVQEFNKEQEEEMQRQIGEYGRRERDKQCQMNSAQSSLDANHRILADNCTSLANAQNELSSAERRLRNKKREARNI